MFDVLERHASLVAVDGPDAQYLVSTSDRTIGRGAFVAGEYQLSLMQAALALVADVIGSNPVAGRSFLDIGANIGTSTVSALLRFGARDAVAIEPDRENWRLLRCNLLLNGLDDRCRTFNLALSNTNASLTLERSATNSGDHRIRVPGQVPIQDLLDEKGRAVEEVQAIRFDDLVRTEAISLDEIGLAWIDTQGHEAQVLEGAPSLLASGIPVVTEFWPYGLRRAGGLGQFCEIVADTYDTVIDVREYERTGRIVRLSADKLDSLTERYLERSHTDLVLVPR
jgi:FkbM family methyltransferase